MAIIKFVFYLIFFVLIKIGDFVYAGLISGTKILYAPFILVGRFFKKLRLFVPKSDKRIKEKVKSRKTIRLNHSFKTSF